MYVVVSLMAGALVFCTDTGSLGTVESGDAESPALCFKGVSVAGGTSLVA